MTVALATATYRDSVIGGHDGMDRALAWQSNAGTIFGLNCVYAASGATTATTTSQVKTVNSTQFSVGGKLFTKGATDNFWTLAGTTVAAGSFQKYALCVSDAGVASVVEATQSTVSAAAVTWQNVTPMAKANPQNPWAPIISILTASRAIFAILTIATDASHTFIPGTTLLGAAGITATLNDGIDPALMPVIQNDRAQLLGLTI